MNTKDNAENAFGQLMAEYKDTIPLTHPHLLSFTEAGKEFALQMYELGYQQAQRSILPASSQAMPSQEMLADAVEDPDDLPF